MGIISYMTSSRKIKTSDKLPLRVLEKVISNEKKQIDNDSELCFSLSTQTLFSVLRWTVDPKSVCVEREKQSSESLAELLGYTVSL